METDADPMRADPLSADPMSDWPIGRLLSTASRLVEHAWLDALAGLGLTHAGLIVLHLLDDAPATQTELARAARVEAQTMSRTIERLQRGGFVERAVDAADRRRRVVARTASGAEVFARARTIESELFPEVTDVDRLRASLLEVIRASGSGRWTER